METHNKGSKTARETMKVCVCQTDLASRKCGRKGFGVFQKKKKKGYKRVGACRLTMTSHTHTDTHTLCLKSAYVGR